MITTFIILVLWTMAGLWFFMEHLGDKYRKVSKIRNFFERILMFPMGILIIIPLGMHLRYRDWKNKSKITSS